MKENNWEKALEAHERVRKLANPDASDFAAVRRFGGSSFYPREARGRLMSLLLVSVGTFYLAFELQTIGWRLIFLLISSAVVAAL